MRTDEEKTVLARNLIRLRKAMRLTQLNVASAIGIERSRYAHYEATTMPSALILRKLSLILNVYIDELLSSPEPTRLNEGYGGLSNANLLNQLKPEEKELVLRFMLLDAESKKDVNKFVENKLNKVDL